MINKSITQRCSVRGYEARAVEDEKITRCLEAARQAPSACNSQPWHFIVVDNQKFVQDIAQACVSNVAKINTFIDSAPVIIVMLKKKANLSSRLGGIIKHRDYRGIDLGSAAENFCLQAVDEGLGTCMIGWYDEKKIRRVLDLPRDAEIELLISVGYPEKGHNLRVSKRKSLAQIASRNGLTEPWLFQPRELDQD